MLVDGGDGGRGDADANGGIVALVDWIETHNARIVWGSGNERAAELARSLGLPGVAASDAHSTLEVGVAYNVMDGDPSTPDGLRAALPTVRIVPGRASYVVRLVTPVAKLVHAVERRRVRKGDRGA
ncbi:MAG TPA: PHP-associated domain-containing protein [Candidatus Limnocylindrales bacterium]|nr:PHP-associated domain-containing protein [Candidatus Limnocylindrales bacterium]